MGFDAGSIFAKLTLDKTGWNAAVQGVVTKDQKALVDAATKIGRGFTDAGKAMTVAGGAITAAFGLMIKKTADYGDELNDMSKRTGIATDILSGYKMAADQSGTSLEGVATGLRGLARVMNDASDGMETAQRGFEKLGISYADNEGKLRPLNDVMLEVADRFAMMPDGAQKTALAMEVFGRSGMDLIPMLNLGRDGLMELREEAERTGMVMSQEDAEACDKFNDSLVTLQSAISGAGKEIGQALMPSVESLVGNLTKVVTGVRNWAAEHPGLTKALSATGLAIGGVLTGMGSFLFIAGTLITKLLAVASALHTTAAALTATTALWSAAVLGVGYYVAKLFELADAENYAAAAGKRSEEVENRMVDTLSKAAVAADWQFGRMSKLIEAYHGNIAALTMAIQKGKEGKDIQEALAEVSKKDADAYDKWREKMGLIPPALGDVVDEGKKFQDWLEGLVPDMDLWAGYLAKVDKLYADGKLSEAQYAAALKTISDNIKEAGGQINRVLPPARDLKDVIAKTDVVLEDEAFGFASSEAAIRSWARELNVGTDKVIAAQLELANLNFILMGLPQLLPEIGGGMTLMATEGKEAAREVDNAFSGLWNNIAQGFGNTVTEWIRGATTFKDFMDGLWQDILQGFTQWIGQKLTSKMVDFFDGLFSKAKKTGEGVVGTVQSLTSGATELSTAATGAISGVWTAAGAAIGSFLGTTLAGIFGGGPSGHQQQQQINDAKDSRNYLADIKNWLYSAGSGYGQAVWDYSQKFTNEKIDEAKGFIAEVKDALAPRIDTTNSWLDGIYGAIKNLKSAAGGAVSTTTELVAVHGTPANPEYIIPSRDLASMLPVGRGGPAGKGGDIVINQTLNINGQVITDREYTRTRLVPELFEAGRSGLLSQLKAALGVA